MAKRTEGFDETILLYAKQEFLDKGYENASLRVIAQNANLSTSTIYTRFKDKEGLFRAVVSPCADSLLSYMQKNLQSFQTLSDGDMVKERVSYEDEGFSGFMDIFYENFDEFKLLVKCSTNDLYREFLEKAVSLDVECTKNFLKAAKSKAYLDGRLTDGFIHVVSSAFYSGIFEIAVHDMKRDEAEKYVSELRNFYSNGWKEYL